jgi:hypothetical protein
LDVNDNYPHVYDASMLSQKGVNEGPLYEIFAHIAENSKYGTEIAKIKAFDVDLDRNITYKVANSSKNKYISVDEITGNLP